MMDTRFIQAHREARWALYLALAYLLGWIITAYLPGEKLGITGLPYWFELSCLALPVLFIILCWLMIKIIFKDISLEDQDES